ncbi:uncharacterized protein LOC114328195 [Diabrotica virgifera virgifera]|uniref:Uncharacterized protein n=2 Tax=Diabrotica virgifera virgifera TaxID=50390 RepID=A0ABM5IHB9_DIAVI|nr:uncharacterized protein LOC114328195 [Diabrotica virgifera virgifera]
MQKYNCNIFTLNPKATRLVSQQDTGLILPMCHTNYYVYNVGKTSVKVTVKAGTRIMWIRNVKTLTLEPGQDAYLDMSKTKCLVSGVDLTNTEDIRGYVHCCQVTGYPFYDNSDSSIPIDINMVSKILTSVGPAAIPKAADDLSKIIHIFWPENQESLWEKINSVILHLLDTSRQELVQSVISKLAQIAERLRTVMHELEEGKPTVQQKFLSILEDLVDFQNKFRLERRETQENLRPSYKLLPYYSAVVNLRLKINQFAIINRDKLSLDEAAVKHIQVWSDNLINDPESGAIGYITSLSKDRLEMEYKTCYAELLYDGLVTVRGYCILSGLQFFPLWKSIVDYPNSTEEPYNDVIIYSTYWGRATPRLHRQMVTEDHVPPVKPALVNGKRNQPTSIVVYTLKDKVSGDPVISGLTVQYENGEKSVTGKVSPDFQIIEFDGNHVTSVSAYGWGQIDGLKFSFCNGHSVTVGTTSSDKHEYHLQNHHIVGFFLANDFDPLEGQAANIFVSFQLCQVDGSSNDKCVISR